MLTVTSSDVSMFTFEHSWWEHKTQKPQIHIEDGLTHRSPSWPPSGLLLDAVFNSTWVIFVRFFEHVFSCVYWAAGH